MNDREREPPVCHFEKVICSLNKYQFCFGVGGYLPLSFFLKKDNLIAKFYFGFSCA